MKSSSLDAGQAFALVREALVSPHLVRAIYSDPGPQATHEWRKVLVRPVVLKAGPRWQVSRFDAKKDFTQNYDREGLDAVLDELEGQGFRSVRVEAPPLVQTFTQTPKGSWAAKVQTTDAPAPEAPSTHDRKKNTVLDVDHPEPFLGLLGFLTSDGKIRADKRDKFTQINEFLRILDETGTFPDRDQGFSVVDFGCGNAYLTFALYHRLVNDLGVRARITGVDLKDDLIRAHRQKTACLGWAGLSFTPGTIRDYRRDEAPDAVVALHACDTATDDAIARGVAWGCSLIVVAPCCQHHLQVQLAAADHPQAQNPLFRYGLMSERLGDLLTDTFRAQLLRLAGYTVDVVQFVDPSHTPKNLMIRAVKTGAPAPQAVRDEYEAMKAYWGVRPYLEGELERLSGPGSS